VHAFILSFALSCRIKKSIIPNALNSKLKAFIFKFKVKSDYKTQMIVYRCYVRLSK